MRNGRGEKVVERFWRLLRIESNRAVRVRRKEYKGLRVVAGSLSKNHPE